MPQLPDAMFDVPTDPTNPRREAAVFSKSAGVVWLPAHILRLKIKKIKI